MEQPMRLCLKVRHYEVDEYGHVNHASYVHYLETARIEALNAVGLSIKEMRRQGILAVAADLSVKYHSPASPGETLEIVTHVREIRGAIAVGSGDPRGEQSEGRRDRRSHGRLHDGRGSTGARAAGVSRKACDALYARWRCLRGRVGTGAAAGPNRHRPLGVCVPRWRAEGDAPGHSGRRAVTASLACRQTGAKCKREGDDDGRAND